MRRTRRARRGSGFTLIELMIVVAMVGVLLGLAVYTLQNKPRPYDAAETTASLVRQAARKAVEGGSVRPDVAARLGTLARTRVLLTTTSDGLIDVAVEQLAEDPQPSDNGTWQLIAHKTLGRGVTLSGWSPRAELADGTSPDTTVGASDVVEIDSGHQVMISQPERLAAVLESL